jgi:hypothetical protein
MSENKLTREEAVDDIVYRIFIAGPCTCKPNKHGEAEGECQTCSLRGGVRESISRIEPDNSELIEKVGEISLATMIVSNRTIVDKKPYLGEWKVRRAFDKILKLLRGER